MLQLFTFVIGQCFVTMLCSMKWGVFIFFAGIVIIMTLWVALLIPGACPSFPTCYCMSSTCSNLQATSSGSQCMSLGF